MRARSLFTVAGIAVCSTLSLGAVVQLQAARDNTLFEESPSFSNGIGTGLFAGETSVGQIRRGLIAFDLTSIPAGSVVNSVRLTMRMSRTATGSEPVQLHFALAAWGEGTSNADVMGGGGGDEATPNDATWSHRLWGGAEWSTPGGDFRPDASALTAVAGTGFYSWSGPGVIADVQSWVNNAGVNNGWFILGNESINQTAKRFDTREVATFANRPVLEVDYTVPNPASGLVLALAGATFRRRHRRN
jgi:hypothetical protein